MVLWFYDTADVGGDVWLFPYAWRWASSHVCVFNEGDWISEGAQILPLLGCVGWLSKLRSINEQEIAEEKILLIEFCRITSIFILRSLLLSLDVWQVLISQGLGRRAHSGLCSHQGEVPLEEPAAFNWRQPQAVMGATVWVCPYKTIHALGATHTVAFTFPKDRLQGFFIFFPLYNFPNERLLGELGRMWRMAGPSRLPSHSHRELFVMTCQVWEYARKKWLHFPLLATAVIWYQFLFIQGYCEARSLFFMHKAHLHYRNTKILEWRRVHHLLAMHFSRTNEVLFLALNQQ